MNRINSKSFILAVIISGLLIGSIMQVARNQMLILGSTQSEIDLLSILYFLGSLSLMIYLETDKSQKNKLFLLSFPASLPYLYLAFKGLQNKIFVTTSSTSIIALAIILSCLFKLHSKEKKQLSLLNIVVSLISISLGITFLFSIAFYIHPIFVPITNQLPVLSIILIFSGLINLKLSLKKDKINSVLIAFFALPILFLGIYNTSLKVFNSGLTYLALYLMILLKTVSTVFNIYDKDKDQTESLVLTTEINRNLQFTAVGSLFLFISTTFLNMFSNPHKELVIIILLIFAVTLIVWFQILPEKFHSRRAILSWLIIFTLFIVSVCILQSPTTQNPLILLFSIPIYFCTKLIGKNQTIYPTWIALIGVTIASFTNYSASETLSATSIRYIIILTIAYISKKV